LRGRRLRGRPRASAVSGQVLTDLLNTEERSPWWARSSCGVGVGASRAPVPDRAPAAAELAPLAAWRCGLWGCALISSGRVFFWLVLGLRVCLGASCSCFFVWGSFLVGVFSSLLLWVLGGSPSLFSVSLLLACSSCWHRIVSLAIVVWLVALLVRGCLCCFCSGSCFCACLLSG